MKISSVCLLAALAAVTLHGQQPAPVDPDGKVITSEKQKFKVEVLTRDLEVPWGIAFLPDGRLLVTERPGRLRILNNGQLSEPVKGIPTAHVQQDGGLLDVTVHPQYAQNGWIYLSYSEVQPGFTPPAPSAVEGPPSPPAQAPEASAGRGRGRGRGPQIPSNTVIVRGKLNASNEWTGTETIFRAPAALYSPAGAHFGSRFIWDQQNHLFFSIGDRGTMASAQDLGNPHGKIHRVNDDGTAPRDNPFVNRAGALPTIWSYGHRNPQGLAWDPVSGKLWASEHGPQGGDEVNIIEPGRNYGWAVISHGGQGGITEQSREGMEQPVVSYTPTVAPSAMAFYTGTRYPGWRNTSLFLCTLLGQQVKRLEISGDKVTHQEAVLDQLGRVHDIIQGPDGLFYLALQTPTGLPGVPLSATTPGSIVRLVPVQ
jgi:glucose/arabinose dehydrogenase